MSRSPVQRAAAEVEDVVGDAVAHLKTVIETGAGEAHDASIDMAVAVAKAAQALAEEAREHAAMGLEGAAKTIRRHPAATAAAAATLAGLAALALIASRKR